MLTDDIVRHLQTVGEWRTLDQIVASLGPKVDRLTAARYFAARAKRIGKRPKDQKVYGHRLAMPAEDQVRLGRREKIRDTLVVLVRSGKLEGDKRDRKFVAYRYRACVCILWAAAPGGYRVQVVVDGKVVEDYSAGNCRFESQTYVPVGSANAWSVKEVRWGAKRTAEEFARQRNLPKSAICEDADLYEMLKDDLRGRA